MTAHEQFDGCEPILSAHLLRTVDDKLIELLRSLTPGEWQMGTHVPGWRVHDVAAHLLDTALRKVSLVRDGFFAEAIDIRTPHDLVDMVNRLNREGVTVYRRLSPAVLTDLMALACDQSAGFHESLDPFARAAHSVSWAGEDVSLNWFDTARELTERWHHQQQIRLATGRPGILTPELYHPVLDCFLRGLPAVYRDVHAPVGTAVLVEIVGACGGRWRLSQGEDGWRFLKEGPPEFAAQIRIPEELAWRVFTKGIDRDEALSQTQCEGDAELAGKVLQLTAVVG
jgi:uncharacterized protein (TIGR03083 family)